MPILVPGVVCDPRLCNRRIKPIAVGIHRKRPDFPSGAVLGLGLSMGSWISQSKQGSNVVFARGGRSLRSVGL
jgi:hypothetical protein